jgi:glutamine amidotransferase
LLNDLDENDYFYFVHSYYAPVSRWTVASCCYINDFSAVVARNNIMGTQFHPEKSGDAGHRILKNFLHFATNN